MTNATRLIGIYNTGFTICMVITILAVIAAVIMFFKFEILVQMGIQTGKTQRITVKRMHEQNMKTGTLRQIVEVEHTTGNLNSGAEQTSLLAGNDPNATTPLSTTTTPLKAPKVAAYATAPETPPGFKFAITESTIVIHTNEII